MFSGLKIEKLLRPLVLAGLIVLVIIIFSQKIEFTASDLGRHLENGKVVWQNRQVLFTNFYSYTEPASRFVNHHWLAGVIYYGLYLVGGFKLLSIFNIVFIVATFVLAFRLAQKRAGFYLSALLSLPVIFLLSERVEVRPEIFSYFFVFLVWLILEKASARRQYRLLWFLVPIFFLWSNIHIYFFLGLALVGFKFLAEFLPDFLKTSGNFAVRFKPAWQASKVWARTLGVAVIACLFNPNFIRGLVYPFNIFKNYGYEIAENKTVFYLGHLMINYNISLFKLLLFLLVISFGAAFFLTKKINLFETILGAFFSVLALVASRNLALFGLVSLVLLSSNVAVCWNFLKNSFPWLQLEFRDKYRVYAATVLLLVIWGGVFYLFLDARKYNNFVKTSLGWGLAAGSEDSVKFFQDNKLSGPIFNNYDLGSALIFWLYPQEKVFVDNRPEAYSSEFFNEVYRPLQMDRGKWLAESEKYKFKTIYFSHTDSTPWGRAFLGQTLDDNWSLVYFDRYTVIFLNRQEYDSGTIDKLTLSNQAIRERLRALVVDASLKNKFQLASLASLLKQTDIAEEIYREIIFSNPDNGSALSSLASLYAVSQDRNTLLKSLSYFQAGLKAGYKLPSVYNQIGLVNWSLNDYKNAEAAWRSALKLERKNASALYYLEQVRQLKLQGQIN